LIQTGILTEGDAVELLEGYVVLKMPRNPPHDGAIQRLQRRLFRLLPAGWDMRIQSDVTLSDSEPEPDLAVARGDDTTYGARHPGPADVGLIVEVADSTLATDRTDKGRLYARAGVVIYWVVNLPDGAALRPRRRAGVRPARRLCPRGGRAAGSRRRRRGGAARARPSDLTANFRAAPLPGCAWATLPGGGRPPTDAAALPCRSRSEPWRSAFLDVCRCHCCLAGRSGQ
jgi:hypothetical protein